MEKTSGQPAGFVSHPFCLRLNILEGRSGPSSVSILAISAEPSGQFHEAVRHSAVKEAISS